MSLVVGGAYGIPTVALRFFNVYGPGQALSNPYTGVAAIFASRLLNEKPPIVFEDGLQSRDFIHVEDIVRGILLALESDDAVGQAVNLGTGRASTVNDIALDPRRGPRPRDRRRGRRQVPGGRHPPLLRRHAPRRGAARIPSLESLSRTACVISSGWLADQEAVDRVDAATSELAERGLTR